MINAEVIILSSVSEAQNYTDHFLLISIVAPCFYWILSAPSSISVL